MSWVNDLASGLGIPAGAATLAVAMYAACCVAKGGTPRSTARHRTRFAEHLLGEFGQTIGYYPADFQLDFWISSFECEMHNCLADDNYHIRFYLFLHIL